MSISRETNENLLAFCGDQKFATIYADPPWRFQNRTGKVAPENKKLTRYETMDLEAIKAAANEHTACIFMTNPEDIGIYNIHADAYGGAASIKAKEAQFAQLAEYIKKHSVFDEKTLTYDHAVIVTGDFNQSICDEEVGGKLVANLLEECYLNDAWAVQTISEIQENPESYEAYYTYAKETNLGYDQTQGLYDSVERIVFADGNGIDLTLDVFAYMQLIGVDKEPLSDHCAATAVFNYEIVERVQDTGINHEKEDVKEEKGMLFRFLEYIASIFRAFGKLIQGLGSGITL